MMILITGGAGYLGSLLAERLNSNGQKFIAVDLLEEKNKYTYGQYYQGNICDEQFLYNIFKNNNFEYVFHFATQIDFKVKRQENLYNNNIHSTQNIVKFCKIFNIKKLIFTSSNSIYLGNKFLKPITELDEPIPIDAYGKSKVYCENLLSSSKNVLQSLIFRCPNILDAGRVGMLSLLFDFLRENKICWMIGDGNIKHQCIYAQDLFDAMFLALKLDGSYTFNIGAQSVSTFKEMSQNLIVYANSKSKIKKLPSSIVIPLLKALYKCGLSPLGPYQFRMLTQDFSFDISYIKKTLNWQPTLSNSEMLIKAYEYYINNFNAIHANNYSSANKGRTKMGIMHLIKFFS